MANMNCTDKQNSIKDGRCCDRCPAGKFVKEDCSATNMTKCSDCPPGSFTDELNYLKKCIPCQTCIKNSLKETHCTAKTDTVCKCKEGFYCSEAKCDHCEPWTLCPVGEGVKIQPTPTTNTVCTPCGNGTYSNITDYSSSCKPHFRCEDYGLQQTSPGTSTTDAICQNCKSCGSSSLDLSILCVIFDLQILNIMLWGLAMRLSLN
ncbi:hypothetical protein XENORESO_007303 [Xenotaenia resolanae]|uniref:TNFR-Cys domain-containing protein n=1 Tax=Xenotaenia resolanae TaxID=208358 RepID=A0ABV0X7A5_9TELE